MKNIVEKESMSQLLKESLLLSCTTIGRTTSSSHAEKSVTWEENRLCEKKTKLDEKLYKSLVKLNSDKLQIIDELTQLHKSRSTGNLESINKHRPLYARCKSARPVVGHASPDLSGSNSRRNSVEVGLLSVPIFKSSHGPSASKDPETSQRLAFKLGGESSSEESGDEDKDNKTEGKVNSSFTRTISVVSCRLGHECGSARSELYKFQNASRRYTNQLNKKNK